MRSVRLPCVIFSLIASCSAAALAYKAVPLPHVMRLAETYPFISSRYEIRYDSSGLSQQVCELSIGQCSDRTARRLIQDLEPIGNIEKINISYVNWQSATLLQLVDQANRRGVSTIDIRWAPITEDVIVRAIAGDRLRNLALSGGPVGEIGEPVGDWIFPLVARSDSISSLTVSSSVEVTGSNLSSLGALKTLKELHLSGTSIGDDDVPALRQLTQVNRLTVSHTSLTEHGIAEIFEFPNLRALTTSAIPPKGAVGKSSLEALKIYGDFSHPSAAVHLRGMHKLRHLTLAGPCSAPFLRELAKYRYPLESLSLKSGLSGISETAKDLLAGFDTLTTISIDEVDGELLGRLEFLEIVPNLTSVSFAGSDASLLDKALKPRMPLQAAQTFLKLPKLKYVSFSKMFLPPRFCKVLAQHAQVDNIHLSHVALDREDISYVLSAPSIRRVEYNGYFCSWRCTKPPGEVFLLTARRGALGNTVVQLRDAVRQMGPGSLVQFDVPN